MSSRPNIVFLPNDHQLYYRHGWDAGPEVQRPNFGRLASEGIEFERAYTVCPICSPARRTMLTGLFPHVHHEVKNGVLHPYEHEVYLDCLAAEGYRSYYHGKWHAGPDTAHRFHCQGFNYPGYNNPYTKPEYRDYLTRRGLPEPEIRIERVFRYANWQSGTGIEEGKLYRQQDSWCNEHATGILQTPKETNEAFFLAALACDTLRQISESDDERPFALRVDFWGPHQPHFPTQEFFDLYSPQDIPLYGNFRDDLSNKPDVYRYEQNIPLNDNGRIILPNPLPWSEWQRALAHNYAQTTMVDAAGGMVLDTLDELGLADNTLVIWTADHGSGFACHGGHYDKDAYMPEELVRVPMAIRFPGRIYPGQKTDSLVSLADIAPTILDAAGTRFHEEIHGTSLLPLCIGEAENWRQDLMCATYGHITPHQGRLLVTDRFKYVANQRQMDELYDLVEDPYELVNLIDDASYGEVLADMQARLRRWQKKTGDTEQVIDNGA